MKRRSLILDCKKILHQLLLVGRFKPVLKEKQKNAVCPCQELKQLSGEIKLLNEKLDKLNSGCCSAREVQVEHINVEKVVLESLSFDLGNIDVDAVNGTMNIGVTLNLQSGSVSPPEKIKLSGSKSADKNSAILFDKRTGKKEASYRIYFGSNPSIEEITPEVRPVDNSKKAHHN